MSRDVKGLFLGVRFASSGVIIRVIVRLQLEDELHVRVGSSVRGVKGLLGLNPLGLISRLLRSQVNLSIQGEEMYQSNQAREKRFPSNLLLN